MSGSRLIGGRIASNYRHLLSVGVILSLCAWRAPRLLKPASLHNTTLVSLTVYSDPTLLPGPVGVIGSSWRFWGRAFEGQKETTRLEGWFQKKRDIHLILFGHRLVVAPAGRMPGSFPS